MNKERLQKIIANNTEYSRRKAEELIIGGKVKVNGKTVKELGTKASIDDEIIIDGKVIYKEDLKYFLVNKPANVICTTDDEKGRDIITNYVHCMERVYPVGRLDYNTTGLILLTNDGELANGLMHPKKEIEKTYSVVVNGDVSDEVINEMRKGVVIDGYKTARAKIRKSKYNYRRNETKVEITIHEGRNRQIRKMFGLFDLKVTKLKRIKYAIFDLELETLPIGAYRELKVKEIQKLYNLIGK